MTRYPSEPSQRPIPTPVFFRLPSSSLRHPSGTLVVIGRASPQNDHCPRTAPPTTIRSPPPSTTRGPSLTHAEPRRRQPKPLLAFPSKPLTAKLLRARPPQATHWHFSAAQMFDRLVLGEPCQVRSTLSARASQVCPQRQPGTPTTTGSSICRVTPDSPAAQTLQ